jgi:hypothetical protein
MTLCRSFFIDFQFVRALRKSQSYEVAMTDVASETNRPARTVRRSSCLGSLGVPNDELMALICDPL